MRSECWRIAYSVVRVPYSILRALCSLLPTLYSLLPLLLFIGGLLAYVSTLAPTVLDGDAALFQYTPAVLGVTYPTGFPTYILLGRLWILLVPIGSIAYRMNLLSAVCGALALAFLYPALRRLLESRLAALSAVLIFATLPTYWRWATEAKSYTLHILLLSGILWGLTQCANRQTHALRASASVSKSANQQSGEILSRPDYNAATGARGTRYLMLAAALFGLALGNHNTTILLAPGLFLFFWLECRPLLIPPPLSRPTSLVSRFTFHVSRFTLYVLRFTSYVPCLTRYLLPIVILPLLLYLYVPLRAEWLLAREGTLPGLTVPVAVARGLVADFYHSGLNGLVRYFTAADFTRGVVTNWDQVPHQLVTVYWPLVRDDFTPWGAALGLVGAVYFAAWRPRRFWPLFLMYGALVPFVLTYGQGEQSAFLLPSSLMLATFGGAAVAGGLRLIRFARRKYQVASSKYQVTGNTNGRRYRLSATRYLLPATCCLLPAILMAAVAWLPIRQAERNVTWLTHKWDDSAYQYWNDVLAHPMEPGAGILAHWGDLTSFWYLQHVEGLRPDLYGLYPPTEEVVVKWLAAGHDLYIAGPLQGWAAGVETRYNLLPWGRLVRLAPRTVDPLALLPPLLNPPADALFGGRVRLLKVGFETQARSGGLLPVMLAWQASASPRPEGSVGPTTGALPADAQISLRLIANDGAVIVQFDDALVSGWLPADSLPSGQILLSFHRFKLPAGTLPGDYRLQLALFQPHAGGWPLADGRPALDLGRVTVTLADPSQPLDPWSEYKPVPDITFGGEIRLVGYDYSVTRAGQGKGFAVRFLWQALHPPAADYSLMVELVDAQGKVWRDWRCTPTEGRAPTSTWTAGQLVRDQVNLVIPATAPPGEDTLQVRLSWLRPDGSHLPVRRWLFPAGDSLTLPGVRVVEKEDRLFELPPVQHATSASFDDKIELVGYDLPVARLAPGDTLPLTLVWQSRTSDMRESYTVFVHLVGPDGAIHGQWDKVPGARSKQPTTGWVAGEVVVDPIEVPLAPDAPPGTYRIQVGFYLAPDGPRLPLRDESGAVSGDVLELGQIEVTK